jgi:imidazoleglycerol phosphate synthase glutamine amidotransferase subunit HisH
MIYILDYDKNSTKIIADLLIKNNFEISIGLNEILALKADAILLPDCKTPQNVMKKLHLLNLFSALRLSNKKIIGIGNGVSLMCLQINEQKGCGFFNYIVNYSETDALYCVPETKEITSLNYFINNNYLGIRNIDGNSPEILTKIRNFLQN